MAARFLEDRPALSEDPRRAAIRAAYRADEAACVAELLELAAVDERTKARIRARALELAGRVRRAGGDQLGVEAFLHEYQLSTREGIMLMCLAEALLRIPDADTADRLIRDKLSAGEWSRHLGRSGSLLVNASTWGLMLTGRVVRANLEQEADPGAWLTRLLQRLGEPVLRQALLRRCACSADTSCSARPSSRRSGGPARRNARAIATRMTCWARPPVPPPTPRRITSPIETRSLRSARPRRAAT